MGVVMVGLGVAHTHSIYMALAVQSRGIIDQPTRDPAKNEQVFVPARRATLPICTNNLRIVFGQQVGSRRLSYQGNGVGAGGLRDQSIYRNIIRFVGLLGDRLVDTL